MNYLKYLLLKELLQDEQYRRIISTLIIWER
jgi:hypothetical protein